MTDERRKWLEDSIASMQAELAEKPVERRDRDGTWGLKAPDGSYWRDQEYRAKPTPKYRPFTSEESGRLLGRGVNHPAFGSLVINGVQLSTACPFLANFGCGESVSPVYLCNSCTFADTGKPCGVLVEGEEDA